MERKPTIKLLIPLFLIATTILSSCGMENNKDHKEIYTLGIWTVKPGKEKEFISEWSSFANWTGENIRGSGKAYLLKDELDSLRFISFGPWSDENSIQKWRNSNEFKSFVSKVKILCDDFQPNTLRVVSTSNEMNGKGE